MLFPIFETYIVDIHVYLLADPCGFVLLHTAENTAIKWVYQIILYINMHNKDMQQRIFNINNKPLVTQMTAAYWNSDFHWKLNINRPICCCNLVLEPKVFDMDWSELITILIFTETIV